MTPFAYPSLIPWTGCLWMDFIEVPGCGCNHITNLQHTVAAGRWG